MVLSICVIFLGLAFSSVAAVAPKSPLPPPGAKVHEVQANFDDIPATPLVANLEIDPIGPYKSLSYLNFLAQQPTEAQGKVLSGIQPQSNPNLATSGLGSGNLTVHYAGSKVAAYDLEAFYFACFVGTANQAVVVPASCKVDVDGYRDGVKVASDSVSFKAPNLPSTRASMSKVTLPASFKLVQSVLFSMPVVPDVIPAYDNFSYRTYNVTK